MTGKDGTPAYIHAYKQGLLPEVIRRARRMLDSCTLCPRRCRVDRTREETGFCRAGYYPEVSSYAPHFGEENPLVGHGGSGTIFLTHCNLGCLFCQNYAISHLGQGRRVSFRRLAGMMVELQRMGCHNINFVSPTHYVPQILMALHEAIESGLSIPLVYNTGGYDSVETLRLLEGIVDIYMPDFKFSREDVAQRYSQAPDYPRAAMTAIKEMHRQVGDLVMDDHGIATRGLLVRHLVLPGGSAGTREIMHFLAAEVSPNTYVNIMDQYYPCGNIPLDSPLGRRITRREYEDALEAARNEGISRLDQRGSRRLRGW